MISIRCNIWIYKACEKHHIFFIFHFSHFNFPLKIVYIVNSIIFFSPYMRWIVNVNTHIYRYIVQVINTIYYVCLYICITQSMFIEGVFIIYFSHIVSIQCSFLCIHIFRTENKHKPQFYMHECIFLF